MSDFTTNILIPPSVGTPLDGISPYATLTPKQWALFFFRVREWAYVYSSTFNIVDPGDPLYNHSATSDVSGTGALGYPTTPTDELDLISPGFAGFLAVNDNYVYEDTSTASDDTTVQAGFNYELNSPNIKINSFTELKTPAFSGAGSVTLLKVLSFSGDAYNTIAGASGDSISITNVAGSGKNLSGVFSLTLVPSLYWSWGGKFDTATGAPI